jgi:hypothetical protein
MGQNSFVNAAQTMLELFEKLRSALQTPFGYQLFGNVGSLLGVEPLRRVLIRGDDGE